MAKSDALKGFLPGYVDSGKYREVGTGASGGPWPVAPLKTDGKQRLGGDTQSKHEHAKRGRIKNVGSPVGRGKQPKKKYHPE